MNLDDLIGECKLFYFAGQDTTSSFLVWTMVLLSSHLEWQAHAREEVLQVFGKQTPSFDGLSHLKIVTMILYEVLRLYPPGIGLTRIVPKDVKLGNLSLPAGVKVSLPTIMIHHDCELWVMMPKSLNLRGFLKEFQKQQMEEFHFCHLDGVLGYALDKTFLCWDKDSFVNDFTTFLI